MGGNTMKWMSLLVLFSVAAVSVGATPEYKAKKKMGQGKFKNTITYLAMGGEMVYALESSGRVHAFSAASCNRKDYFDTGLNNTQSLAVNDKGEIFVFATTTRQEQRTHNNRKYTVDVPTGVTCKVFNTKGKELRTLKLDSLKSAKAAKFAGDKLVVADLGQTTLFFLDPETGKETAKVKKGLRLCCGIFDFCVGPEGTVAVANLGAFQVQQYNMDGKLVKAFGKRGKSFDEFHGCCNPVSAGYLADGGIITVEKDPTRIKVYDADGKNARGIDGIENLVEGCSYIPVAIDDDGNVFLAATRKGYIVKCTPKS
jgi:hypothetical protein